MCPHTQHKSKVKEGIHKSKFVCVHICIVYEHTRTNGPVNVLAVVNKRMRCGLQKKKGLKSRSNRVSDLYIL